MELDALKEIWTNSGEKSIQQSEGKDILNMLNKPSQSPIARMKRNLLYEFILVVFLFGAVAVYYFMAFKGEFSELSWVYIALTLIFGVYYYFKNKLLNEMQCTACRVKSNLQL